MPKQHNWNAYKIFKNGRRAKQPICKIMANNAIEAEKNFLNEILPKLSDNFATYKWAFIHEDVKSQRITKKEVVAFARSRKRRKLFFGDIFAELDLAPGRATITLIKNNKTDSDWEWAVCQPITLKKFKGLSPQFKNKSDAFAWMDKYLQNE